MIPAAEKLVELRDRLRTVAVRIDLWYDDVGRREMIADVTQAADLIDRMLAPTSDVEQIDRDAAADWTAMTDLGQMQHADRLRAGGHDNSLLVQAFARHRIAALAAMAIGR